MSSSRHSFKIHRLKLARGINGRKPVFPILGLNVDEVDAAKKGATDGPVGVDYLDTLHGLLVDLKGRDDCLTDVPKLIAVADGANQHVPSDEPGTPRLVVTEVSKLARRISVEVEYGHLGWSHRAVGATRTDEAKLDHKSPMEFFRLEFLVPSKGHEGLIMAEIVGGGSALPALVSWINHAAREKFGDDKFTRLMAPQLADEERLKRLISGQSVAEIELFRKSKSGDGAAGGETLRLIETVRTSSTMTNAQALASGWLDRQKGDDPYADAERIEEVGRLADIVDDNARSMGFTDGKVKFREEGETRFLTVSPSKSGEIFVYSISERRPDTDRWEKATKPKALEMAKQEGMSLAWG